MYIIRSNIFRPGSETAEYFSRYRIQVSVLHRPDDEEFNTALKEIALQLHILTGKYLVFFPMIDPPEDYLNHTRESGFDYWWKNQKMLGGEFDDVLVNRLASFYDVAYSELPVLVISPSLWGGKFIILKTDKDNIEKQFSQLTTLANQHEKPDFRDIEEILKQKGYSDYRIIKKPSSELAEFYSYFDKSNASDYPIREPYSGFYEDNLNVEKTNKELHDYRIKYGENRINDEFIQKGIQKELNLFIAPALVAIKRFMVDKRFTYDISYFNDFEKDSQIEIRSVNLVDSFIRLFGNFLKDFDYTIVSQGYWKAFENEINYSIIQAERECLGIDIKNFYTLYQPGFPIERSVINSPRPKNLNDKDFVSKRHRFLTLGDAWYVTKTMLSEEYKFSSDLLNNYQIKLSDTFMKNWRKIYEIRNEGSHIEPLDRSKYEILLSCVSMEETFEPLMRIKKTIKTFIST